METLSDDWDDRTIVGYPRIYHYYPIVIENKFSSTWTPLKSKKILQKCSSKIFHLLKLGWIFEKRTYLRVSWRSTIDLRLMNLPKRSLSKVCWKFTPWVKFYFGLSLHIFLWKMRATPGACIKPGCLTRRPLCHKVNLPASCEAQRLLCHILKLSCVARRP